MIALSNYITAKMSGFFMGGSPSPYARPSSVLAFSPTTGGVPSKPVVVPSPSSAPTYYNCTYTYKCTLQGVCVCGGSY